MYQLIQKKLQPEINTIDFNDYKIKDYLINNYSEICYLIAKKKDFDDIIIPIQPQKLLLNKKYNIVYKLNNIPTFTHVLSYMDHFNLIIQSLIVSDGYVNCILFENDTYLPIISYDLKNIKNNNYIIINSKCSPYTIDNSIYNTHTSSNDFNQYINHFNSINEYKTILFNHILNLIYKKNITITGIILHQDININDHIFFKINKKEIIPITKDNYYLMLHKLNYKKSLQQNYTQNDIPYYGKIIQINKGNTSIHCTLSDTISMVIKDNICIYRHKVKTLLSIIYNDKKTVDNELILNKNEIFKTIKDDEFNKISNNKYIQYSLNGNIIKNPSIEEKIKCISRIYIKEEDIDINNDIKLLNEFIYKLINNIENGNPLKDMNKIVDNVIKVSTIEKNTPSSEIFYKYIKDKQKMEEQLKTIFNKKSDFILSSINNTHTDSKQIHTTKLKQSPFHINKLYGYNSSLVFSIDNMGNDWFSIIHALKEINLSLKFVKGLPGPRYIGDIQKLIINGLNKFVEQDTIEMILSEYNKYNRFRDESFTPFQRLEDIKQYWLKGIDKRINIPDIKIILQELEDYYNIDLGIIVFTFNNQNKNYIYFYNTNNLYNDTPILSFHHILYKGDYILANISKNNKLTNTVQELLDISDEHNQWIHQEKIGIRPCEKQKLIIQKAQERIEERDRLNDLDKETIRITESTYCKD